MATHSLALKTEPYAHQIEAETKLSPFRVGALFAEMGTGKTRMALALIKRRLDEGKVDRVIWLCPCAVKRNLKKDIIKHTGVFDNELFRICGIETLSSSTRENLELIEYAETHQVYLIVDESSLVKNPHALRTKNIIRLAGLCQYKLILNGTPIGKNEADLFSQWLILDWRIFGYRSYWSFEQNHLVYDEKIPGKISRTINVDYLTRKMEPYTYQVLKKDCLALPPTTYHTMWYDLTDDQMEHYQRVADRLLFDLDELRPETLYRLFSGLQSVISGMYVDTHGKRLKSIPFWDDPMDNPRLDALDYVLKRIGEYKVIIYVHYLHESETIIRKLEQDYGKGCAVPYHGMLTEKKKNFNMEQFEQEAQYLIMTKGCGAFGHNLQYCSHIVFYNNDWDSLTRSQAIERIARPDQQRNMTITDIGANDTLDERIFACLSRKENIADAFRNAMATQSKENQLKWLNRGA